jgi:hypothetical protein
MADAPVRHRGHGEDAIYCAADKNRYIGAVPLGFGPDGRRLRHTFVSIMSVCGVPVEEIGRLAGNQQTSTTELVYRIFSL